MLGSTGDFVGDMMGGRAQLDGIDFPFVGGQAPANFVWSPSQGEGVNHFIGAGIDHLGGFLADQLEARRAIERENGRELLARIRAKRRTPCRS